MTEQTEITVTFKITELLHLYDQLIIAHDHGDDENHMFNRILEYVKYECQLEDGETHQDLIVDLHNQVTEAIEKDDNRKL